MAFFVSEITIPEEMGEFLMRAQELGKIGKVDADACRAEFIIEADDLWEARELLETLRGEIESYYRLEFEKPKEIPNPDVLPAKTREIDIVFDGPPGPVSGRFIEVEDVATGASIGDVGEWIEPEPGVAFPYWRLRMEVPA